MSKIENLVLESAHSIVSCGFRVLPIHGLVENQCSCGKSHGDNLNLIGKHPVIRDWQSNSTVEPSIIDGWFANQPGLNLAVDCAKSGVVVLDIDPRSGGDKSYETLMDRVPELADVITVETLTGDYDGVRGRHIYFKAKPKNQYIANFARLGLPGIDVKHKGYVIAPNSAHRSGVRYEWVDGHEPWSIGIATLPDQLSSLISKALRLESAQSEVAERQQSTKNSKYGDAALNAELELLSRAREGERNNAIFKAGAALGSLVGGGELESESTKAKLREAGRSLGLSDEEVEATLFRSGGAFEVGLNSPRASRKVSDDEITWASKLGETVEPALAEQQRMSRLLKFNEVNWDVAFASVPDEKWLVPGVICQARSHALYSDAGVGKTLLMHDICAALASGKGALGFPALDPLRVLYIDHENTLSGDVVPHLRDMGYSPADLSNLIYLSFPEMASLDSIKGGLDLELALDEFQPKLVIIDTVSRTVNGDENANDTWLQFYNFAGKAMKRRGIAYVRLDHIGKNAESGMRGGSAKKGDLDLVWHLKRKSSGTEYTLKCEKNRVLIPENSYLISRNLAPLSHKILGIGSEIDWAPLLKRWLDFSFSRDLLIQEYENEGRLLGQRASWDRYKGILTDKKISRKLHFEAHSALRQELDLTTDD